MSREHLAIKRQPDAIREKNDIDELYPPAQARLKDNDFSTCLRA